MGHEEYKMMARKIAESISQQLFLAYGENMQFFMCAAPFSDQVRKSHYVGNIKPCDTVVWMAEFISEFAENSDEDSLLSAIEDLVISLSSNGKKKELIEYLEHVILELKGH